MGKELNVETFKKCGGNDFGVMVKIDGYNYIVGKFAYEHGKTDLTSDEAYNVMNLLAIKINDLQPHEQKMHLVYTTDGNYLDYEYKDISNAEGLFVKRF